MGCCGYENSPGEDTRSRRMARIFGALSHPARLEILQHISRHRYCKCKEITDVLPLAQSTVSQHLKVLVEAELIICETVHPSSHYKVNDDLLREMARTTGTFLNACCKPGDRP